MSTFPPGGPLALVAELARADLAGRLQVEPSAIELKAVELVTWPDGSLGCPQPGQFYTQALVEGYRVLLDHASRLYAYHAGRDAQPFLCPSNERDGGRDFVSISDPRSGSARGIRAGRE